MMSRFVRRQDQTKRLPIMYPVIRDLASEQRRL